MTKTFGMDKDNIEYQDILDKLLLGQPLNNEEKVSVENNPKILNDLQELKLMKAGLTKVQLEEKRNMLSEFEKENYPGTTKPKRALPAILFSTILSLLIIGYMLFKTLNKQPDVSQYFTPYPLATSTEDNGEDVHAAYKYYNDAVYQEANPLFDSHLNKLSSNKDLFYYGVSLIGSGNQQKAIEVLNNPKLLADNTYPSNYYLGLAYLDIDQKLARRHLEQTQDYDLEIQKQAQHLLSILK